MRLCRYLGYFPKNIHYPKWNVKFTSYFFFGIQLSERCIPVLTPVIRKSILVTHFGSQILKYPKWSDFELIRIWDPLPFASPIPIRFRLLKLLIFWECLHEFFQPCFIFFFLFLSFGVVTISSSRSSIRILLRTANS